ncbi:MAG: SusC/RagA family TonB-linked outer membrane protein, partial [Saprospiraceae bacterium]|nr:SusC/RagA family TonB-linked outer membrane protein [Saprospiraceae bacterium]
MVNLNLRIYVKNVRLIEPQKAIGIVFLIFFALISLRGIAQKTVSGVIADENGLPLTGANVEVKGTTRGTFSDPAGFYSLSALTDSAVLVFSYAGMESRSEVVGSRNIIDISLRLASLPEVVVTALGISRAKQSLGYGISEVKGEELQRVTQENVLSTLAGRVPGMQISQVSGPGSTVQVVIRGMTSLTTDNQPLFVVDGIPMANSVNNFQENGSRNQVDYGNAISDINPNDIESISVLKGPSAAALYGSRAGNGVILITTRSGSDTQDIGIDFSTSNVFSFASTLLDYHYLYASGERNAVLDEGSAYWGGPELDRGNHVVQWNSPEDPSGTPVPTELKSYPNNMREFLQTGVTSNNNIAITAGGGKGNVRLSYSNMLHRGMIPNSDLYRNALAANINYQVLRNLTISTNMTVGRTKSNDRPSTGNRGANPLQAVYVWPHVDVRDLPNYWLEGREDIEQNRPSSEGNNPYFIAYGVTNAFSRDRLYGNIKLNYQITSEISVFIRHAIDQFNENRETKIPFSYTRQPNGGYWLTDLSHLEENTDFLATYSKVLGNFDFRISTGGNYMKRKNTNNSIGSTNRRVGLTVPGIFNVTNINRDNLGVSNNLFRKSIYSLYGLASIGFNHLLYLDLTGRNDWSSTLPAANRSYYYPSISLSWILSETFNLPRAFSLLKLRAGWAQVGNDTDPYLLEPTLETGNYNDLTTVGLPSNLLNPNLKPEIATSTEFGVDINLMRNRILFDATYYMMKNKNQIFSISLPQSSGFSGKFINAGLIESSGWEIRLGLTPISRELIWDVNFNFSTNKTILKELTEGKNFIDLWQDNNGGAFTFVGDEIGDLYSAGYARVMDPNSPYYLWPI